MVLTTCWTSLQEPEAAMVVMMEQPDLDCSPRHALSLLFKPRAHPNTQVDRENVASVRLPDSLLQVSSVTSSLAGMRSQTGESGLSLW